MGAFSGAESSTFVNTNIKDRVEQGPLGEQTIQAFQDPSQTEGYARAMLKASDLFRPFLNNAQSEQQKQTIQTSSSAPDIASIMGQDRGFQQAYITQMINASNQTKLSMWQGALDALTKIAGQKPETVTNIASQ